MNVDTPAQGLRLLLAQCPDFKKDFMNSRIRIRVLRHGLLSPSQ